MKLGVLVAVAIILILLVIVGTYIKSRNQSQQRKDELDKEYEEQKKELLENHPNDPLELGLDCCQDPSIQRQIYYALFKTVAENYVRRHGVYITNNKLRDMERDFRDNYNILMKADFQTAPGHFQKLKALLKDSNLMQ